MSSLTIYKRELRSYFGQPTAYAIIVIFLALSMGLTFSFGNFMRIGDASLEWSFFFWHPWIYMLLAPAVGMKLWSDEQRNGTIELLGTFLFAFVVLTVGTSRLTAGNSYYGFAIALAALGVAGIFSDFGSSINPASSLASSLFGACAALSEGLEGTKAFVTETVYLAKIAPRVLAEVGVQFLGAALAAWFFRYLFPEDR